MTEAWPAGGSSRPWRLVFFGSPDFSLPALKALAQGPDDLVMVVAPPPAPAGRGRRPAHSPVGAAAAEMGLNLFEAKSVKSDQAVDQIASVRPDLLVVAAYGGFLPPRLLNLCPTPPLNIHPSLLPRHRGPAPVSWALMAGDRELGVSIIFLEQRMDAGPILSQRAFPLAQGRGAGAWEELLAEAGARDLLTVIADLKEGRAQARPQAENLATTNRLLRKEDGRVDFQRPASELAGLINGVDPWPGARCPFRGRTLKLFGARAAPENFPSSPGRVLGLDQDQGLKISCGGDSVLLVAEFQPEGKKRMAAAEFERGYRPEKLD